MIPSSVEGHHVGETAVEYYPEPMPLVVEIWSIDPRDRSVTSWVRGADGSYAVRRYARGTIRLSALADVEITLESIFRRSPGAGQ